MKNIVKAALIVLAISSLGSLAYAGVPLTNTQGVGGIAFNPLAYPAGQAWEQSEEEKSETLGLKNIFSKPQIGGWYVNLNKAKIDWTTVGVAETLFKRLELSYGHETVSIAKVDTKHINNIGAKLLLLPENSFDTTYLPAISVGTIFKQTAKLGSSTKDSGEDIYLVATKLITKTPKPVLLSGGVLSSQGHVVGVLGYDKKRDTTGFFNIDVLPTSYLAVGFEYKQGAEFKSFKNADYWDAHLAWFVNKDLSLIAAYVNTGDINSSSKVGFADGIVLSSQYQF